MEHAWAEFAGVVVLGWGLGVRARGGKSWEICSCSTFGERMYNGETFEILNRVLAGPYL